jgi:integrase
MADNIRPLPSGKYQVRMQKDGTTHKGTFDTLKEAKIFRASILTGNTKPSSSTSLKNIPTFNDLWETYIKGNYWSKKKDTTKARELQLIKIVLSKIGAMPINQIKKSTISEYRDTRTSETYKRKGVDTLYSGTQIRLEMCLISAVISYILKELPDKYENWMLTSPCLGIAKPKSVAKKDRVDNTDYLKLLDYFKQSNDRTAIFIEYMLQIAYHTGMRVSEIARMERHHIRYDDNSMRVYIHIPVSKNEETRDIPVNKRLKELLKEVVDFETTNPELAPPGCKYIFWSLTLDGKYRPYTPAQYLKKVRDRLGIEKPIHFHQFRHENISQLVEKGKLSPVMISRRTGHKSMQVMSGYVHASKDKWLSEEDEE